MGRECKRPHPHDGDRRLVSLSAARGAVVSSRKPLSTGVAWGNAVHRLG